MKKRIFLLAISILTFVSCSKVKVIDEPMDEETQPIEIIEWDSISEDIDIYPD